MLNLGRGQVALTSVEGSPTRFDYGGAGFAVQTGWVGASSAILVQLHDDGPPTLFGLRSGNGFADLAALEDDRDGTIAARDAAFGQLDECFDADRDLLSRSAENSLRINQRSYSFLEMKTSHTASARLLRSAEAGFAQEPRGLVIRHPAYSAGCRIIGDCSPYP